jgi:hypothetical protein
MVRLQAGAPRRLAAEVRASLVGAGYEYVEGGSGPRQRTTAILVPAESPDARAVAKAVALALGLDPAAVRTSENVPPAADVLVVVGSDVGA